MIAENSNAGSQLFAADAQKLVRRIAVRIARRKRIDPIYKITLSQTACFCSIIGIMIGDHQQIISL